MRSLPGPRITAWAGLGFVGFAEEVRTQEAQLGFQFDYIVVCSVTGSTQAGMVVGFAVDGRSDRVIGIDASAKPEQTREQILRIAQNTAELVELGRAITAADVALDTRYAYPAYGLPSDATLDAIRLCARLEGMLTDPVYEGKSMQGLIDMVKRGDIPAGSKGSMRTWAACRHSTATATCSATVEPGRRNEPWRRTTA